MSCALLNRFGVVRRIQSCIKEEVTWPFLPSSDVCDDIDGLFFLLIFV